MLKIMQHNCRGYYANRHLLQILLQTHEPDVLLLNSTCTNKKIKQFGYTSRQSEHEPHEGVAILVKSNIKHEFITNHTFKHFMSVKIHTQHGEILVCTTYSRPNTIIPYHDLNNTFNNTHIPTFLLADLNAKHTAFQHNHQNAHGQQLHTLVTRKNLHHLGPFFPTTYGSQGGSTPDIIIANTLALQFQHHITPGPLSGSDHIPITLHISNNPILIPTQEPRYQYKNADWESFSQTLAEQNYTLNLEQQPTESIETTWNNLFDTIKTAANTHIPKHTYKTRYSFKPSLKTQRLLGCYNRRFEQHKNNFAQGQRDITILRRHLIHSLLHDHNKHWAELIDKAQEHRTNNPREFWQKIAQLRGTARPQFDFLLANGRKITEPDEIAHHMKEHWKTVFHPHPTTNHADFIEHTNTILQEVQHLQDNITPEITIDTSTLDNTHILTTPLTVDEVKQALSTIKKKAPGDSGIGHQIIIHLPPQTIQAITYLFNTQLATGYFPQKFKSATAVMIPKPNKNHTDPQNYRPISLLEVIGKTFEKLYNTRLRQHLEGEELMSYKHFGFRAQHSTQSALNLITNYIHMNKKTKTYKTAIITKDVQKAFDTVWHDGLRFKICTYFNLPIKSQKLLCNFLEERKMRIRFNNAHSEHFTLNAGVPQGSVLSPTLYIMYTNDLPDPMNRDSLTIQYADDVTQLIRHTDLDRLTRKARVELNRVTHWELTWRINTNPTKSKITYFGTKRHQQAHTIHLNPYINTPTPIPVTTTNNILGVTFDDKLNMVTHTNMKHAMANKALTTIYRFKTASVKTKTHLYKALIRPLITYAPNVIQLTTETNKKKLQTVQNKALRFIHNTHWQSFTKNETLHERTNIQPLNIYWRSLGDKQIEKMLTIHPHWLDYFNNIIPPPRYRNNNNLNNHSLFNIPNTPHPQPLY